MIQYMSPLINDFYLVNLSTVEVILLLYGKITLNRSIKLLLFLYSVTEACQTLRVHGLCQASLSFIISKSVLKLMFIESVMPFNHFILCIPLLLLSSIFPSIRVSSSELVFHIRWSKYWSCSFNISPSNEYSGLIPFRTDWFDLLAGQETLKSLPQYHS